MRRSPTPQRALGRALGLRRREVKLTPEEVADLAELSKRTVEGIEAGKANPTGDTIDRVARALGLAHWELAKLADKLETKDRRPTNKPLRRRH
jgi:transcriptional regulator with XRE-family HTH domain